jgi:iron complex outermembrane receptor protein
VVEGLLLSCYPGWTPVALLMLLRLGICLLILSCANTLRAQRDSLLLKEVTIYGLPEEKYLAGSSIEKVDSSLQKTYSSNHLGEVLSYQLPIYFRNYGNGMISGISMRGTTPQHTAVLWNGININSFSLGQADFSILPMIAFDEIKVHEGGGSARFGSGAFGGTVLLNSTSQQPNLLAIKQEVGSFGRFFSSVKASFKNNKLSSSTSLYRLQSKNDFPIQGVDERQQHASFYQQGIVQNLQYDISANKSFGLHYWFHDADREIQPPVGKVNSTDEQQDRNHRLSLSYQQNTRLGLSRLTGGFVDDVIVYNGSKSEILRWIASANHQYTFQKQWHVQFNTEWNHIIGKIKEYGGEPQEDRMDVAGSVQKQVKNHSFSFNLRQPFISRVHAPLLPYLGANIMLVDGAKQKLILTANVSKNFRAPTFNERYWQSAGRVDLLPETSHAAEAGLSWNAGIIKLTSKGFYQIIDQWIQWVPDGDGNYRPENIKQVKIRGSESSIELQGSVGVFSFFLKSSYQFTRSTTSKTVSSDAASIGKQLIYTPLHTATSMLTTRMNNWSLNVFAQYSGKRFTEASNDELYSLAPFVLVDISAGRKFMIKRSDFDVQFSIKNVFNTNYQLYAGRAMPGRYFNLQLNYQLKHK